MRIFIGSLVIFFGTLLAAGLVALGQPVTGEAVPGAAVPAFSIACASPASGGCVAADSSRQGDDAGWEQLLALRGFH